MNKSKGNSKRIWKTLKKCIGNKKQSVNFNNIDFSQYQKSVEENMNNFYSDSLNEIAESIKDRKCDTKYERVGSNLSYFNSTKLSDLKNIVFKLKNKIKSKNILSIKVEKELFCVIGYPSWNFINTSLSIGKLPKKLKTSVIVPILNEQNPWRFPSNKLTSSD